jgi:hypothetical protein
MERKFVFIKNILNKGKGIFVELKLKNVNGLL